MNYKRPDNPHVVCPECDTLVHPMDLCCGQCVTNEVAQEVATLTDQLAEARRQIARYGAWEAKLLIAHQAFNVVYNCTGAPEQWERGKKLLVELRGEWDEAKVPLPPAISPSDDSSSSHSALQAAFLTVRRALKAAAQIMPGGDPVVFVEGQIVHVNRAVPDALRTTDDAEAVILEGK